MTVESIAAASNAGLNTAATTRIPKQSMDSDVFMSLLVTQLQNQDPSSPMDTNEMIAQTTQLAMMEKITAMTTASQEGFSLQMRTSAAAMVGQTVTYSKPDGTEVTGVATSVSFAGAVPQVTVDGNPVALDVISGVRTPVTT
ncbi:MAG: flagellar hook capping protein [Cryobacterium sp.]|uniref:flagellar hook capping FlgD N-terminal domain-containing protein n=1 Tax=unclassified Cryobacterium TaxID=2649013 RepID=UPI0018C9064D|nr:MULTISPECIES: flagellar hook capping FlgD N-terminal domain-containing protein [unclassified Cryobacterium]MCY7404479.1 flagellar hook capping protein [Cryobacterium sp.]MEC5153985.1 flagellar basal-body rod modification protein FlgD [Cryobacterium sp. CAN_C3]